MTAAQIAATPGLLALIARFRKARPDSFGLFLGAGVNLPPSGKDTPGLRFKTYCWGQLLQELHQRNKRRLRQTFDELRQQHRDDWLGLATALVGGLRVEAFIKQIDAIIYNQQMPRGDKKKGARLSKRFLEQAPTLHAAIAFSTVIAEKTRTSWTFVRNPKIGAVITPNYDFFFGAGLTRYQAFKQRWKVQTPFSTKQPAADQRPINYIHGYLPYRPKLRKTIVLTRETYDDAYSGSEAFARRVLRESVQRYSLIFLGTSFDDPPLRQALTEQQSRQEHFAIIQADAADRVRRLGVIPVVVDGYAQVAAVLRTVYCAAVSLGQCRQLALADQNAYWDRLLKGPETSPKRHASQRASRPLLLS